MNKQLLNDASKKLSPKSVLISSSNIWVDDEYDSQDLELIRELQSLKGTSHLNVEELESDTSEDESKTTYRYNYIYNVGIRCTDKTEESEESEESEEVKVHFEIKAKFKVTYISEVELDHECASEFAQYNVGHTVWPYWREYVQSSCSRLGIANIDIPFYSV
jgi:hypothetical protein